MLAFVLLALPSVLAGAYAGVEGAPRDAVDAARAMGMTEWQILFRVEAPLGMPLLLGGIRSATLQCWRPRRWPRTSAQAVWDAFLFLGLKTQNYPMMVASSLVVVGLAVVVDLCSRSSTGSSAGRIRSVRSRPEPRPAMVCMFRPSRGEPGVRPRVVGWGLRHLYRRNYAAAPTRSPYGQRHRSRRHADVDRRTTRRGPVDRHESTRRSRRA